MENCFKRIFDIVIAAIAIVLFLPFMLLIAYLIKYSQYGDKGPVLFTQHRIGRHGVYFRMHKFRTMVINATQLGGQITANSDTRITPIGKFLRKSKLDELPQLFDVFWGTMSLVGPRPEVPKYVAYYSDEIKQVVLSVKPGITDWASIEMIDEGEILAGVANPEEQYINVILPLKLQYAVKYVTTKSLVQDLVILVATCINIIRPGRFIMKK